MVPSGNTLTILVLGVYPVTVVIALALFEITLERSDTSGAGSGVFFGAVIWPLTITIVGCVLVYHHFDDDHPYENTAINRITA